MEILLHASYNNYFSTALAMVYQIHYFMYYVICIC